MSNVIIIQQSYAAKLRDLYAAAALSELCFRHEHNLATVRSFQQWGERLHCTPSRARSALHLLDKLKLIKIGWEKGSDGMRRSKFFFQGEAVHQWMSGLAPETITTSDTITLQA